MKYINSNKINEIKLNKDNFYVITDFDCTLTEGGSFSTWRVLCYSGLLGDDFQDKYMKIHADTEPDKNAVDEVKAKTYEKRFKKFMNLLEDSGFNEEILKRAVRETELKLRDGAKEFLRKMQEMDVPVIIISSSIGNVIKEYLKFNKCYYSNIIIYSNFYDFRKKNKKHICNVTPYFKNRIIHSDDLRNIIQNRKYILLSGDLIEDINMVDKDKLKDTITVGFFEQKIEENLDKYNEAFDIVLTENTSFENIIEIIS